MRIAFYAPRASFLGPHIVGEATHLANLLAALQQRGHATQVVSRINVRDFWRGRVPARKILAEAVAIRRSMKRFQPDAWLVFGANGTYPDLFGWWQFRTRYVLVGIDPWTSNRMPRRWRWPFDLAFRISLKRASVVAAYRPRSANRLRSMGIREDKLELFLPAVKLPKSIPTRAKARNELGLPDKISIVLCISRLPEGRDHYKTDAVVDLVSMADDLPPNSILAVVGDGEGRQRVLAAADKLTHKERVRIVGFVPDTTSYYAACDLFANPIHLDRPWVSVIEAQSFGRPVVLRRSTSAEATVEDRRTGLLADDLDEFRKHVVTLAGDRDRCNDMGQAAREYVGRCHSIERQVAQIEKWLAVS